MKYKSATQEKFNQGTKDCNKKIIITSAN